MLLRHLDDHGAQQQQRNEVRDGHEAVERVGDIPHERQVRDRAGHNDEAEDDLIGADDLAAKEELRAARAVERPAEDGGRGKQQQADRQNNRKTDKPGNQTGFNQSQSCLLYTSPSPRD